MSVKRRRQSDQSPDSVETTDLVLKGEADVDEHLVASAVSELNRIYVSKGLEMARLTGEYVLKYFFAGNSRAFEARARAHASFRALAARPDLEISASGLWYSVKILPQLRELPTNIATALPLSHHRLLVHIKDDKKKLRLATKAARQKMSKRELKAEIAKAQAKADTRTGRPPLPAFVRGVTALKRAVATATSEDVEDGDVLNLDRERAEKVLSELDDALETLQSLRERIHGVIASSEDE